MYRVALLALISVWAGILFAQEVDEPGYHRPSAAQGLTIETHDVHIVCPDGPHP